MSASVPRDPATLEQVPHGATTRRLDWMLLPPTLRREVERRLGSVVVQWDSAGAGFTPGLASTLTCADGRRVFLKAASRVAQRPFADAYAEEARKLRALPEGVPVPRLLWDRDADDWVVLCLEHVEHRTPARPWREDELDRCLDTLELLAERLTPPPMALTTFAEEFADDPSAWDHVRRTAPGWPHLEEAAALADRFAEATAGTTLVHTDVRDDNLMLTADGRALLCDWNWPVVGAAWIDTVCLLIAPSAQGLDVEGRLASRAVTRHVDQEHVDALLALLAGFFLERRDAATPTSSPYLRRHQAWFAEATWAWLARRRGWA